MQFFSFLAFLAAAIALAEASDVHHHGLSRRHQQLSRQQPAKRSGNAGRCKPRPTGSLPPSTPAASPSAKVQPNKAVAAPPSSDPAPAQKPSGQSSALIAVVDDACGPSGATSKVESQSGPNGDINWLNCGVNGAGWTPPYIQISDVKSVDLNGALNDPNSPFHACSDFIDLFNTYANQHGLPPILIASIAMQESTCNPNTVGGAGEQGLMQLTHDKCTQAPGGNCQDPDYNIRTGTQFFADRLAGNNGDVLKTLGGYNGWPSMMTVGSATAAAGTSCCRCQNNLDYLHQTLNGWMQNVNPYSSKLGKYFNLDQC